MTGPLAFLETFPPGLGYRVEMRPLRHVRQWSVFRGDEKLPCFTMREPRT